MPTEDLHFLKHPARNGEMVALHVEATSFDPETARLRTIAAIRIDGNRIRHGHRLTLHLSDAPPPPLEVMRLLRQLGNRPLVGFFLDFSVELLNRLVQPVTGAALHNPKVEVSSLYYAHKTKVPGKTAVDLRLASILEKLNLPPRPDPGAESTALSSALIYLRLTQRAE